MRCLVSSVCDMVKWQALNTNSVSGLVELKFDRILSRLRLQSLTGRTPQSLQRLQGLLAKLGNCTYREYSEYCSFAKIKSQFFVRLNPLNLRIEKLVIIPDNSESGYLSACNFLSRKGLIRTRREKSSNNKIS